MGYLHMYTHTHTYTYMGIHTCFLRKPFLKQIHCNMSASCQAVLNRVFKIQGQTVVTSNFPMSVQKIKYIKSNLNEITSTVLAKSTEFSTFASSINYLEEITKCRQFL